MRINVALIRFVMVTTSALLVLGQNPGEFMMKHICQNQGGRHVMTPGGSDQECRQCVRLGSTDPNPSITGETFASDWARVQRRLHVEPGTGMRPEEVNCAAPNIDTCTRRSGLVSRRTQTWHMVCIYHGSQLQPVHYRPGQTPIAMDSNRPAVLNLNSFPNMTLTAEPEGNRAGVAEDVPVLDKISPVHLAVALLMTSGFTLIACIWLRTKAGNPNSGNYVSLESEDA